MGLYQSIYERAKSIAWLRRLYSDGRRSGVSTFNMLNKFPEFVPHSGGSYKILSPLTVTTINQLTPALVALAETIHEPVPTIGVDAFVERNGKGEEDALSEILAQYGSDKTGEHDYYRVYASILKDRTNVERLFEIGLGTNNTDVASHMGPFGSPGASLRAFRDFLPSAKVFGADIDSRILFTEDRIETYKIDQTNPVSFQDVGAKIGSDFDLMIDDGLHAQSANLHSLAFFLTKIRSGGFAVVEDIPERALNLWRVAALLLEKEYDVSLVQAKACYMFICRKP